MRTKKVLLVENEEGYHKIVFKKLDKEKDILYEKTHASSWEEAIEDLRIEKKGGHHFDVVLIDGELSKDAKKNGIDLCKKLRRKEKSEGLDETLVIIITAYDKQYSIKDAFASGAQDYIVKGNGLEDLLPRLRFHIDYRESQEKLLANIKYAASIQNALLPPEDALKEKFKDYFIYFRPMQKVSGDFYWFTEVQNLLFISTVDCTDHGVPGAYLSILGITYLNTLLKGMTFETCKENVDNYELPSAGDMLNKLRENMVAALHQTKDSRDYVGMDMALIIMDMKNRKCHFAGAKSDLFVLKQDDSENPLVIYKGNRADISYQHINTTFENTEINLETGDKLYLMSDGIKNQYQIIESSKSSVKKVKDLIVGSSGGSMLGQKQKIEEELNKSLEKGQADDILLLGIHIE